ncbi:hypothetical protein ACFWXO_22060 [Kitasatospora sp. NPDC059088]|uniref:hypothetical protein n=1 Tax=Kitasatospora sp. NPDC059088 TaxID=3346722 RepID=UPI0036B4A7B0
MVLPGLAITLGWLFVVSCVAVAVARARGGRMWEFSPSPVEKIMWVAVVLVTGWMLPYIYANAGITRGTVSWWLGLCHAALVLVGLLTIGRLMSRVQRGMRSDALLTEFITEVMPVVVTAQRRSGTQGAPLVEAARDALREGQGRRALRDLVEVRVLVEDANLAEHAGWAKVSEQIAYWERCYLQRHPDREGGRR